MIEVGTLFILGLSAWRDVKKREISFWLLGMLCFCGIWHIAASSAGLRGQIGGIFAGVLFLGLSILSHGDLGMGDALFFVVLGMLVDMERYVVTICLALLSAALWSLVLLVVLRKGKNTEIPLIPFLLLGYVGGLWICY